MSVLFCHGLESAPHGRKYHALADAGLDVHAPDCRGKNLAERIELLTDEIVARRPALVVGSSFGGIAGLVAALRADRRGVGIRGLLLCAPALQLPVPDAVSVPLRCPAPTVILHGVDDDVIPIDVSRSFAAEHGATLFELDDGHRLEHSLPQMVAQAHALLA